MQTLQFLAEAD